MEIISTLVCFLIQIFAYQFGVGLIVTAFFKLTNLEPKI
jgi:hypothetical protein